MADPNKQKDIEIGVAITQGILGGLGNLADAYFASKNIKDEAAPVVAASTTKPTLRRSASSPALFGQSNYILLI